MIQLKLFTSILASVLDLHRQHPGCSQIELYRIHLDLSKKLRHDQARQKFKARPPVKTNKVTKFKKTRDTEKWAISLVVLRKGAEQQFLEDSAQVQSADLFSSRSADLSRPRCLIKNFGARARQRKAQWAKRWQL